MSERILLRVSHQRAYVWDVEDIKALRSQYRVCGLLGGTLPHLSQQNVFLGVPLILMPEEVVLLVEQEIAAIVDDIHAHEEPSKSEEEEWNQIQKHEQQQEIARKSCSSGPAARRSMTEEAIAKRREREERRLQALAKNPGDDNNSVGSSPVPVLTTGPSTPTSASVSRSSVTYTVKIPTSSSSLKWHRPSHHRFLNITAARDASIWTFPSTSEERARCGVYRALWEKGYYMGCGIKFGGDYLVYPGDPLRYHSHFVASVLVSSSPIRPMEIVAHGRLGTATKKAHLLCSWDEKSQNAEIYSIEWAAFG